MFKPEVKKKLLAALRSGKYRQTIEALHKLEVISSESSEENLMLHCFCCLGVLSDISEVGKWQATEDESKLKYVCENDSDDDFPPEEVILYAVNLPEGEEPHSEGVLVIDLPNCQEFITAIRKYLKKYTIKKLKQKRVFECLALMNDSGVGFEQIADLIEKYL